ncbi:MAG: two-component system, NarL family, sensor histidine kinase DegS [Gaiellaceae bacterium]|nr:two-component system, NarL family, sensor histidine kinase DegS [Gaiellaceae bacterium]
MSDSEGLDRLIAAEQDERRRIALFLHDGPVQNLAGIALMLDAALHSITTGKLEDAQSVLSSALDRQRSTIRELRDLSFALEPVVLRDQGFGPALQALAEQVGTANRIRIDLDIAAAEEIGESAQVATYTIIRELLDQAIRRGPPTTVKVSLKALDDGGLETCVTDNAEPERRRRSFEAIEERVKQLHGRIDVDVDDEGTSVVVTLPPYATRR